MLLCLLAFVAVLSSNNFTDIDFEMQRNGKEYLLVSNCALCLFVTEA